MPKTAFQTYLEMDFSRLPVRCLCVSLRTLACAVGGRGAGAWGAAGAGLRSRRRRQGAGGRAFCCPHDCSPAASGGEAMVEFPISCRMRIFDVSMVGKYGVITLCGSTHSEIEYAEKNGKELLYLEDMANSAE